MSQKWRYTTESMKKEKKVFVAIAAGLFLLAIIGLTLFCIPYIERLSTPEVQMEFKNWIAEKGFWGIFIVFGIQVLQIVIAFIPGEPVELVAGVLYGSIGGLVICLLGCVAASSLIFKVSERFGKRLLHFLFGEEKVKNWAWIHDSKRMGTITFILFLMPGTPKDMLTYIAGITEITMGKFILLSTFARIPSILTSTMVGSTMRQGQWEISILVFVLTGIVGIAGILTKDKIIDFCRKMKDRGSEIIKKHSLDGHGPTGELPCEIQKKDGTEKK